MKLILKQFKPKNHRKLSQVNFSLCKIIIFIFAGKYYTGEGSDSFVKLEKPVRRPKGRQLNNFGSMLFTLVSKAVLKLSDLYPLRFP